MKIIEFAERIVFGTTLEEKLAPPGRLLPSSRSDRRRSYDRIEAPGRPVGLEMRTTGDSHVKRPRDNNLENEAQRGKLLHFLANHELLATELMALVLLKFPDAPYAFQRGVLVTLQEEQQHTQMYLDRMRDCGVEFGAYPLSGQFWQIVQSMQSPLDFVSRLSLTFEQANLDYSQHFAKIFARIGDQATASLLNKIYEDEISHVQHGLQWFRQWKDPGQNDWEAYAATLDFPMSPQRARAPKIEFNRAGRRLAGLDESFINALEVFQQSRGRATTVRWFDAGSESELSHGGSDDPKTAELIGRLNTDLAAVMLPLAKPDDVVLVDRLPSAALRKQWIDAGFDLPEFVRHQDSHQLSNRKLHDSQPWVWSPRNHARAESWQSALRHPPSPWSDSHGQLFGKQWSSDCLQVALEQSSAAAGGTPKFFCDASVLSRSATSQEQFDLARSEFSRRGYQGMIFKPNLSASGRGQRRFSTRESLTGHDRDWLQRKWANPVTCLVEPELDRVMDFSLLYDAASPGELPTFIDWSQQWIGSGRRYLGSQLDKSLAGCDAATRQFFLQRKCDLVKQTVMWLQQYVLPALQQRQFHGPLGVDAFVFRDLAGQLKVKPLVELNPRHTMGHVSVALARRLASGVRGQFRIFSAAQWQKRIQQSKSAKVRLSKQGQWLEGVIPLGELKPGTKWIPAVLVGQEISSP